MRKFITGYFQALLLYLEKYYLIMKHYPALTLAGKPVIGRRVKFRIEKGARVTFKGSVAIQNDVIIHVRQGAEIVVGEHCHFNRMVSIVIHKKLTMGDRVMLGENVKVYDNDHRIEGNTVMRRDFDVAAIEIKDGCWIANNAVILKGTTMGPNTVIAALSLASGNLDANALYMGVPCRKMKKLEEKPDA